MKKVELSPQEIGTLHGLLAAYYLELGLNLSNGKKIENKELRDKFLNKTRLEIKLIDELTEKILNNDVVVPQNNWQ